MRRMARLGMLVLVTLAACVHPRSGPPMASGAAPAVNESPERATRPVPVAAAPAPATASSAAESAAQPKAPAPGAASAAAKVQEARGSGPAKPAPGKAATSAAPTATAATAGQPAGAKAPDGPAPSLDLKSLEQRLRDTRAIGLFTKLSLKNQVDDLLGGFRDFHGGKGRPPLPDLRQRYELLLLKVLTLLQDSDQPLASAIAASREAIWGILADRQKFQKMQLG